ncbi:MAG: bactofilin family protein, partial [Longimicrobiales bacterium]
MSRGGERGERRAAAWIGASVVIRGDVISSEDTTIAGRVEGNVQCRNHALVVAPSARIEGDVHARTVSLNGEVAGTVTAEESIEIGQTGSITGD